MQYTYDTETYDTAAYDTELSTKQQFYLYLYQVCPSIDIIDILWKNMIELNDACTLEYYKSVSPFKPHPNGTDSIFKAHCGFIDSDVFLQYYQERENYLNAIKIVGHPDFICKFTRPKEELERNTDYLTTLINEQQLKLTKLQRVKVLENIIMYLLRINFNICRRDIDQIMRYITNRYKMYISLRGLYAYPIGIDSNNELCKFE